MNRAGIEELAKKIAEEGRSSAVSPCGNYGIIFEGNYDTLSNRFSYSLTLNQTGIGKIFRIVRARANKTNVPFLLSGRDYIEEKTHIWIENHLHHFNRWLMNEEETVLPEELG